MEEEPLVKSMMAPMLALWLCCASAHAQPEYIRLYSSGRFISVERGVLTVGAAKGKMPSTMWEKASVGNGLFVLRNRQTGHFLVASEKTLTTTTKEPSRQGVGPHFWRYTQPIPGQPMQHVLTSQSGLYLMESASGLALEATPSPSAVRIDEVREIQAATEPAAKEYQCLVDGKGGVLNVDRGAPTFGNADMGSPGCMWEVTELQIQRGVVMTFTNRKTGQLLTSAGNTLTTQASEPVTTGNEPFCWQVVRNGPSYDLLELTNSQGAQLSRLETSGLRHLNGSVT